MKTVVICLIVGTIMLHVSVPMNNVPLAIYGLSFIVLACGIAIWDVLIDIRNDLRKRNSNGK